MESCVLDRRAECGKSLDARHVAAAPTAAAAATSQALPTTSCANAKSVLPLTSSQTEHCSAPRLREGEPAAAVRNILIVFVFGRTACD